MSTGFVWGAGGQATTPEALNLKRKLLADALAKSREEPIKHWTQGVAHVADALIGGYQNRKLDEQERGARDASSERSKALIGALLGGDTPQPQPQPTAAPMATGPGSPVQVADTEADVQRLEGSAPMAEGSMGAGGIRSPGMAGAVSGKGYDRPEAKAIYDKAIAAGYSPVQASAFTGAALAESAYRPDARNPGDGRDGSDSVGLFQWNGSRAAALKQHAASLGKDWRDKDAQVSFALQEMQGPEQFAGNALRNAKTPEEASAGMLHYLRPAGYTRDNPLAAGSAGARIKNTNALMGIYGNGGGEAAPQAQPVQMAQAQQAAPQVSTAQIQGAMQIINDPWAKPGDKAAAQFILQKRLTAETKDPRDNRLKDLTIAEKEAGIANQAATAPLTRRQAELGIQKTERELAGEGATPLSAEERKSIGVPDGQPAYKTRSGEIKFGPAGTKIVNEAQKQETEFGKETGKALAKRFDQLATDGDEAAQSMELVAEMRRLGGRIDTGAAATVKAYLGKIGVKTEGVSDIEAFNTLVDRLTPQQRVPGSGATSDFDAKMFKGSLPSLMNTPEGNKLILDTVEKISANKIARGDVAMRVQMQELTPKQGMEEIRKLQAEAKAISDQFKPTGKPAQGTPAQPKPGEWQEVDGVRIRVKP